MIALTVAALMMLLLVSAGLLGRTAVRALLLHGIRFGLGAGFGLRNCLLLRPALVSGASALMPPLIAGLAAAMALIAIAPLGLFFWPVLCLAGCRICTVSLLPRAILVGPVTALAAVASSLRTPVMRPSAARTFGTLELGLRPAEAPDFLEFGLSTCARRRFDL